MNLRTLILIYAIGFFATVIYLLLAVRNDKKITPAMANLAAPLLALIWPLYWLTVPFIAIAARWGTREGRKYLQSRLEYYERQAAEARRELAEFDRAEQELEARDGE